MKGPLTVKVPRCIYYIFVYIHLYIYSWLLYIGPLVTFVPSNYLSVVLAVITVLRGKTKEWWWGPMGRLQGKPLTWKSHPLMSNSLGCVWMNAEIGLLTSVSPILSLWSVAFWEHSLQEEDRLNVPTIQWHQRVSEHRMHQNVATYSDVSLIWVTPWAVYMLGHRGCRNRAAYSNGSSVGEQLMLRRWKATAMQKLITPLPNSTLPRTITEMYPTPPCFTLSWRCERTCVLQWQTSSFIEKTMFKLWPAQDYYFCQLAVPVVKIFYFLMKCCSIDCLSVVYSSDSRAGIDGLNFVGYMFRT